MFRLTSCDFQEEKHSGRLIQFKDHTQNMLSGKSQVGFLNSLYHFELQRITGIVRDLAVEIPKSYLNIANEYRSKAAYVRKAEQIC
ncbi:hypothetical protein [Pseudoalteromonas byunsanensis]|uniref:Uncharacterized protein n=1 Tax=Pseudoalteromonas byunsanensis TaxID=327939 RepID=A0A1S1N561_9GAMM|nr:hypothetical protein [Pseudoalteromonas byunsanensis]OHU95143.1 hypothetical protein BIW53_10470 [Pseudoalteromonas byunsanensis]